jgi:hypothetical protein
MNNKYLNQLKEEYLNTPIPAELTSVVNKALAESGAIKMKENRKPLAVIAAAVAAAAIILTIGVNTTPALAKTLADVPILGNVIKVITFREFSVAEDNFQADLQVPAIEGMENTELQTSLNEKYLAENKALYEQFTKNMEDLKNSNSQGHLGAFSSYEVKTDNDTLFSVAVTLLQTAASSYTEIKYDTIDKKNQVLITLPSLFKDDSYVEVISENILSQMREKMKSPEGGIYWIDDQAPSPEETFKKIAPDQNFYINADYKLVISFEKYAVAPGFMGNPEFVIPTEVLSPLLLGDDYLR